MAIPRRVWGIISNKKKSCNWNEWNTILELYLWLSFTDSYLYGWRLSRAEDSAEQLLT